MLIGTVLETGDSNRVIIDPSGTTTVALAAETGISWPCGMIRFSVPKPEAPAATGTGAGFTGTKKDWLICPVNVLFPPGTFFAIHFCIFFIMPVVD